MIFYEVLIFRLLLWFLFLVVDLFIEYSIYKRLYVRVDKKSFLIMKWFWEVVI